MTDSRDDSVTRFEGSTPILRVMDMARSLQFYVEKLGFRTAEWGDSSFTCVNRDKAGIYLCRGGQGNAGTWVWIGVENAQRLYQELDGRGVSIGHPPRNYPWALELHVQDPDGHVLRFGSEPVTGRPFDEWLE